MMQLYDCHAELRQFTALSAFRVALEWLFATCVWGELILWSWGFERQVAKLWNIGELGFSSWSFGLRNIYWVGWPYCNVSRVLWYTLMYSSNWAWCWYWRCLTHKAAQVKYVWSDRRQVTFENVKKDPVVLCISACSWGAARSLSSFKWMQAHYWLYTLHLMCYCYYYILWFIL